MQAPRSPSATARLLFHAKGSPIPGVPRSRSTSRGERAKIDQILGRVREWPGGNQGRPRELPRGCAGRCRTSHARLGHEQRYPLSHIAAFESLYREGRIAFFVGAGASRESGAPMPDQVLGASARVFLPQDARVDLLFRAREGPFCGIQPEVFYEHVLVLTEDVGALHLWRVLSPAWLARQGVRLSPNPNHLALASYAGRTGTPILTTNFDTLIEDAARELSDPALHVVTPFSHDEAQAVARHLGSPGPTGPSDLFKLHGSIEIDGAASPGTLKTTMEGITAVNRNVLRLMRRLAEEHHFAFVGYSGSDIDYFPVLAGMKLRHRPFWFNPGSDPVTRDHASRIGAIEIDAFPSEVFAALHPEFRRAGRAAQTDCGPLLDLLVSEMPVRLRHCQKQLLLGMCLNSVGLNREALAILAALCTDDASMPERDRAYALLHLARVQDCVSRYEQAAVTANGALGAIAAARRRRALSAHEATAARARGLYHRAMARQQQIGPNIRYGEVRWRPRLDDMLTSLLCGIALQARFLGIRIRLLIARARGPRHQSRLAFVRAEHAMNDHLMMLFGRLVSFLEATRLIGVPGLRPLLHLAAGAIRQHAWTAGDYFVYAGAQKYLQRLRGHEPTGEAGETYMLLRDPLNRALVHRDAAVRLLEGGDRVAAARQFRMAADAALQSGSAATAVKALVGLRACGAASAADEEDLRRLSGEVEGRGYRRFRAWLFRS